jgi:hypothetical protein
MRQSPGATPKAAFPFLSPVGFDPSRPNADAAMVRIYAALIAAVAAGLLKPGTDPLGAGSGPYLARRRGMKWARLYFVLMLVWRVSRLSGSTASGLTELAVFLAGRKRLALRDEWRAHLAGGNGQELPTRRNVRIAFGFVASAIQCRLADAAEAAWTPVDAILKSRKLSNLLVFGPTTMAAVFILRHAGTLGVVTSAGNISAIGVTLYGLVRVGRWWRNVKPPAPKARSVKELAETPGER